MFYYIPKIVGSTVNFISLLSPRTAAKLSLDIFSTPRKGKITNVQAQFLNQATKKLLHFNEQPIMTYHWPGKKKTILLTHGWESNSSRWEELINELIKNDYAVIAMDAPAHGDSGSKTFNALLYSDFINAVSVSFRPNVIIGHSVGGMASAFHYAENRPHHLEKIILLGAPAHFEGVLERYVNLMGYHKRLVKHIEKLIHERFGNWPNYYSIAEMSTDFRISGLIIHDELDRIIPYDDAKLIAKNFGSAHLITTKGAGHGLKNQFVHNAILDYLNT